MKYSDVIKAKREAQGLIILLEGGNMSVGDVQDLIDVPEEILVKWRQVPDLRLRREIFEVARFRARVRREFDALVRGGGV